MRFGNIEIVRKKKERKTIEQKVGEHLLSQDVRDIIARMGRSEVKNYLGDLAEEAELPFVSPSRFLGQIKADLKKSREPGMDHVCNEECERQQRILHPERYLTEADERGITQYPFEVGGYANHPEQKEYDSKAFTEIDNTKYMPIPGDEDNIVKGEN